MMGNLEINNQQYAVAIHQQEEHLPWLLMLHGFMGDHRVFDHLVNELSAWCNPVTIDLLGHGSSSKPADASRYHEDRQIEDIIDVIQTKSFSPLYLYGYSMGGRLALKTALQKPALFDGLILESTNCGISDPDKRSERQKIDAERAQRIIADFEEFLSNWSRLDLFQSPIPVQDHLAQKYQDIQLDQSPSAMANSLYGFGSGSMSPVCDELYTLELPVLLIAGTVDTKYQRINQYLLEQLPNATFSSIKASHRVHLDNPSAVISEVHNFLKEL